jgi:hypothetical protein
MEEQQLLVLDDRSSGDSRALNGAHWQLFTDGVMGGISRGSLAFDTVDGRPCLRMRGDVRLENNGGFVQLALDLDGNAGFSAAGYTGLLLDVTGNAEAYNIHLRTSQARLPWQSYRTTFQATASWQTIRLPFQQFAPHRIDAPLNPAEIRRVGVVAIGRAFEADLCVGRVALYKK